MKIVPALPVLLVLGTIGLDFAYIERVKPAEPPDYSEFGIMPEDAGIQPTRDGAFVGDTDPLGELAADSEDDFAGFVLVDKGLLLNGSPASDISKLRNGLLSYKVEEGDTVSTIAAKFGISTQTIIWANNLRSSGLIRPGQEIVILPVSGILHEVKNGESLRSIASIYGVDADSIETFNKEKIKSGDTVIVPNAKPIAPARSSSANSGYAKLPSANGYFSMPLESGLNWGQLHDRNAVDISAACGSPIFASADGTVSDVGSVSRWNGGYGGYVKIKHPNGTATIYAHNSENIVSVGESVSRGDRIASVGRTGKVRGRTGCHVHFGVSGAQNPFVK